jgi:hypothetical protein
MLTAKQKKLFNIRNPTSALHLSDFNQYYHKSLLKQIWQQWILQRIAVLWKSVNGSLDR